MNVRLTGRFAMLSRDAAVRFGLTAMSVTFLLYSTGMAADSETQQSASKLRGEFVIGKAGRLILLPVELGKRTLPFLLDTSATRSAFDESLKDLLGAPEGRTILQTPAGQRTVETFDWPNVTLGRQPLKTNRSVICFDLKDVRQASGEEVFGVIGMDVLRACRLQIDFDRGFVRFLESLPEKQDDSGDKLPILFSDAGGPFLVDSLAGGMREKFLIDTGAHANALATEVFDKLVERQLIRPGTPFASVTAAGEIRGRAGRLTSLSVGQFMHQNLRFERANPSAFGLRYLSRFELTLDFPGETAYLRKGARYSKPDPPATSGMTLRRIEGNLVVDSVLKDGAAQIAGIRVQDVIVQISGKDAAKQDFFSIREMLTSEVGKRVPIRVRRGERELDVEVVLIEN